MMVDLHDDNDVVAAAIEEGCVRAQKFARKAIIGFVVSEAKMRPKDHGAILVAALQAGFLMSLIEAGDAVMKWPHKAMFMSLAGSIYDDVMDRKARKARRKPAKTG